MNKLLEPSPCPFCKYPTRFLQSISVTTVGEEDFFVACVAEVGQDGVGCGARGPVKRSTREAVEAWNVVSNRIKEAEVIRDKLPAINPCRHCRRPGRLLRLTLGGAIAKDGLFVVCTADINKIGIMYNDESSCWAPGPPKESAREAVEAWNDVPRRTSMVKRNTEEPLRV